MSGASKLLGFVLVALGFVGGAFFAVQHDDAVQWLPFSVVTVVGVVGVVLIRQSDWKRSQSEHVVVANMEIIHSSLKRIVSHMTQLNAEKADIDAYDVHQRIDQLFPTDLMTFVGARKAIASQHGLETYADIMSSFAAAERYLNRCWSASADGYVDEVHAYLERAEAQFHDSLKKIESLG